MGEMGTVKKKSRRRKGNNTKAVSSAVVKKKSSPKTKQNPIVQGAQELASQPNSWWDLTTLKVSLALMIIGLAVFFTGVATPFMQDDQSQIVNNPTVHSMSNIGVFFEGSTFYDGEGVHSPLSGIYYRPLMTVVYSIIYTFFHLNTFPYHFVQILLCIGGAILLYLVLQYFFNALLAFVLSIIFLIHPINSQVAFALPAMQDALYFLFGILAIWLLMRFKSVKSLWLVATSLLLCVLSKEAGLMFFGMALLYLGMFERERLRPLAGMLSIPAILWFVLRVHAVGLFAHTQVAPIDNLGLGGRLLTSPSIMSFYLFKLIFPWKLASGYYWVHGRFSIRNVLLPLLIDLGVIALAVYLGGLVKRRLSDTEYKVYIFFTVWAALGMLTILQVFPLDLTACETWFRFSFVGILGMVGCVLLAYQEHIKPAWFLAITMLIIGSLGVRTELWGVDWSSSYKLAMSDIAASKEDYVAYNQAGLIALNAGNYTGARSYFKQSIAAYPFLTNYNDLGLCFVRLNDYSAAYTAFEHALQYGSLNSVYGSFGEMSLFTGNQNTSRQLLLKGIHSYPDDATLWVYLALLDQKYDDNTDAKVAIGNAKQSVSPEIYSHIMNNQHFTLTLSDLDKSVEI